MSKTNGSILNFFKRNIYYLIIALALMVTAIVIVAVLIGKESTAIEVAAPTESVEKTTSSVNSDDSTESVEPTDEPDSSGKTDTPTETKIVFAMPVSNYTVTKDFTSATVVYNKTLGVYTGHMGIDFAAEAGEKVSAAYGGTVASVTTSYLEGTTVTIDHGNGLKTVYNSIDVDDDIVVGKVVAKGQNIGTVSDNNRQEYKDGPHLHFETILNDLKIDPQTYLMIPTK